MCWCFPPKIATHISPRKKIPPDFKKRPDIILEEVLEIQVLILDFFQKFKNEQKIFENESTLVYKISSDWMLQ